MRASYWISAVALICVSLAGNSFAAKPEKKTVTAPTDLNNLQPWCIGRFVINLPAGTEAYTQNYTYAGNKIETLDRANLGFFQRKVNQREQELKSKMRVDVRGNGPLITTNTPWLESATSPTSNSRLLVFQNIINTALDIEGYVLADSSMVILKSRAPNRQLADTIAARSDLIKRVKYRDNWTVPTEAGFCFDGGLMTGPQKYAEFVDQSFGLDPNPQTDAIAFEISMRPSVPADFNDTLLDRVSDIESTAAKMGLSSSMRILRKGDRPQAGMAGQELLVRVTENDGRAGYKFTWESQGKPGSIAQPFSRIELQLGRVKNGAAIASPLSEEEALKFWDTTLNSFKLRPGAV